MTKWVVLTLLIILGVLQLRLWEGSGSISDVLRLKLAIELQTEEIVRLTERNRQLDMEVKVLKANPAALEERARAELGMIKQGETFCIVVDVR